MSDTELLVETNRLLNLVLETDREQREKLDAAMADKKEPMGGVRARLNERVRERMREIGAPESEEHSDNDDLEAIARATRERAKATMEEARQREAEFKSALIDELRAQSELLKQIAEKLGC